MAPWLAPRGVRGGLGRPSAGTHLQLSVGPQAWKETLGVGENTPVDPCWFLGLSLIYCLTPSPGASGPSGDRQYCPPSALGILTLPDVIGENVAGPGKLLSGSPFPRL